MLYRKSELKKHKYFLKSIHGLWILPIVIINLIVPLFNFFIYKLNNNDMVIDIEKIIFFLFPMFSVWTGVLSMLVMYFSKSAPITILVLLLYDLINTFVSSSKVFLLYENFEILTLKMFLTNYFPLIFVAIVFIVIVFKGNKGKFYLLTKKL